ncbi:MAG: 2-amino-4-hydroxy-6-hydroxymethyldihydropteridine diphosphokinase [Gammaproteobacteria bacterium]|nr:2-amino-4-hydroxy-6-hydroxymethyldihydropteridine diphosphokinase [Gammaproteobacteria bacterium]MCF6363113.1 2-amino-4-hydroxy-6-hydroxymethyldihydropteridine diphosphokinase [Gammaproteobacteria bacterium]
MPQVFVGVGSNVERATSIRAGIADLRAHYGELRLSSVYESEAVGFIGNAFYNLVVGFDTQEPVNNVADVLTSIEDRNGRLRGSEKFAPRTLDLDLLLYGDAIISTARFHVPRDEILRYAFVLWPLAEIVPNLRHPETGKTFTQLWEDFDKDGPVLRPVVFSWQGPTTKAKS